MDFDVPENWRYEVEIGDKVVVRDRVEDFLSAVGWGAEGVG